VLISSYLHWGIITNSLAVWREKNELHVKGLNLALHTLYQFQLSVIAINQTFISRADLLCLRLELRTFHTQSHFLFHFLPRGRRGRLLALLS
jgi:hypothetical protein